ncbi:LysR family nod box-dependent transcriptional activator [Undibacterium sp. GrIS 1.2]|uniref:LysR family transcriptional regulator n=1 Tax=Undibacterium sp. GrIS 1.2 TaxID=3143933 RepID=UPI003397A28F
MHFKGLDLNLLVALDVLLKEKSITRASQLLHLSPSSVSGALARLREYFDDEILVLVGRKMVPTPLGDMIASSVGDILLQVQSTIDLRPHFDPATAKRNFTLMMSDYISTVLMSGALRKIQQISPGITFDMVPPTDTHSEALDRGEIDLLIMPKSLISSTHPAEVLFEDSYVCLVSEDNPYVGNECSLEQYCSMGHVVVKAGTPRGLTHGDVFLAQMKIERQVEIFTLSFNCLPRYLIGTNRIATVQKKLADEYMNYLPLKSVPLPFKIPALIEMIQWHRYKEKDPALTWFRQYLKQMNDQF